MLIFSEKYEMSLETDHNALYFLENYHKYKFGKINLLSSKSSVLICREKVKKIIQLRQLDEDYRKKIIKNINGLRINIRKFILAVPKTKEDNKKAWEQKTTKKDFKKKEIRNCDEIQGELLEINKKLAELTAQ
jgi:hypothetical protein